MMGYMPLQQMQPPNMQYGGMQQQGMQDPNLQYGNNMQYPAMYQFGGVQPYGMMTPPANVPPGYVGYQLPSERPASQNGNQPNATPGAFRGLGPSQGPDAQPGGSPAELAQRQQRPNTMPSNQAQWRKTDAQLKAEKNGEHGA